MSNSILAFDKNSQRSVDVQGFMHVVDCNISKATVNPYMGREIPNWLEHGLDPDKVYRILRPSEELEKAAPTFNNLPLLDGHKEVSAEEFDTDESLRRFIVGSTGTNSRFSTPYLQNTLVIWIGSSIAAVESKEQSELSCAYRYRYVPGAGTYMGMPYDGRMADIVGNHVALVIEGRAGRDVMVADAAMAHVTVEIGGTVSHSGFAIADIMQKVIEQQTRKPGTRAHDAKESRMGKQKSRVISPQGQVVRGALMAYLAPRLSEDAAFAPGELGRIVKTVEPGRYTNQVAGLVGVVAQSFEGRTTAPIATYELNALLSSLEGEFANDEAGGSDAKVHVCPECGEEFTDGFGDAAACHDCMEKKSKGADSEDETPKAKLAKKITASDLSEDGLIELDQLVTALTKRTTGDAAMSEEKKDPIIPAVVEAQAVTIAAEPVLTQTAMDAALAATRKDTIAEVGARFQAGAEVAALVGAVDVMAADSAEAIYKMALDAKGIDTTGVHPSAYRAMFKMIPTVSPETSTPVVAADAQSVTDFTARYPHAAGVKKG